jgi:hypothetical protein
MGRRWLTVIGAATTLFAGMGCRAPGSNASSHDETKLGAVRTIDDAPSVHNSGASASAELAVRPVAGHEEQTGESRGSGLNAAGAWSPSRWSGLLGRFGGPSRVPLPRADVDSAASLSKEGPPAAAIDDF